MSPEVALGMMMSGASSIDQAISGKLGVLVFAEPDEYGMETQFSGYLGLEPKGRKLVEGYVSQLAMIGGGLKADMTKDGVSFSTSEKQGGALKLPAIAKNFGKSGMSFFLNLEGLDDTEAVAEMMFMEGGESILSVSKSIYMEYGNDGGKLIIEAKKGNENILKQMLQGGIEAFQGQMSGFAI